ncbi:MAG: thioredoxin family protein [Candidatus Odinarchaeota archaeon]
MHVLLKNEEENYCAKCCKTMNIIERIFASIPEFKEKIEVSYEDIYLSDNIKRYGELTPPAIIIEDHILIEGHVPIMKKLARDLFSIIETAKS